VPNATPVTSRKAGAGGVTADGSIPGRAKQRFFRSVGLSRSRFATWEYGSSAVKATA
jgi:hypothetical protein